MKNTNNIILKKNKIDLGKFFLLVKGHTNGRII